MTNGFSYLRHAKEDIENLKIAVAGCRGTAVATNVARATRDVENALYNKEIDGHTSITMTEDIGALIKSFDKNCECKLYPWRHG